MSDDIITSFASDDSNRILTRKNLRLALAACILVDIYSLFDLIDSYLFITKNNPMRKYSTHFIYTYRVRPLLGLAETATIVVCYIYTYIAFRNLSAIMNEGNSGSFQKANRSFYTMLILKVISASFIVASCIYRVLVVQ